MSDWILALALYVGVPTLLAIVLTKADWKEIANAYFLFWAVLVVLGLASGGTTGEKFGWPLIFWMFLSAPAIPVIVVLSRLLGFRLPWLR